MKKRVTFLSCAVLRSLRFFIIIFAFVSLIFSTVYHEVPTDRIMRLLPLAAGYALSIILTRVTDNRLLMSLSLPVSAGLVMLTGFDTLSYVFGGITAAAGFIYALADRIVENKGREDKSHGLAGAVTGFVLLLVMVFIAQLSEVEGSGEFICTCIALYFPIAFASWLFGNIERFTVSFAERPSQPFAQVRKNIRGWAGTFILIILAIALVVPMKNGVSAVSSIANAIGYIIGVVIYLITQINSKLPIGEVETPHGYVDTLAAMYDGADNKTAADIARAIAIVMVIGLCMYIIYSLARAIISFFKAGYAKRTARPFADDPTGDIVEQIEIRAERPTRGLFRRQTAADKIRLIYRDAVRGLVRHGVSVQISSSPDEICAAAAEKGCDMARLTDIYKQARYTPDCPDELLAEAKQAVRHIYPDDRKSKAK